MKREARVSEGKAFDSMMKEAFYKILLSEETFGQITYGAEIKLPNSLQDDRMCVASRHFKSSLLEVYKRE